MGKRRTRGEINQAGDVCVGKSCKILRPSNSTEKTFNTIRNTAVGEQAPSFRSQSILTSLVIEFRGLGFSDVGFSS